MMERTAQRSAALADELRNVVIQAEALLQALAEDKNEAVGALRERVQSAVAAAKTRLTDVEKQASDMAQRASVASQAYVRENPWTVIGGAVATGLMLGAAFTALLRSPDDLAE
jgi:ElaB/YqjD/DUF883 family membrane-anchored ribosome-binding protein